MKAHINLFLILVISFLFCVSCTQFDVKDIDSVKITQIYFLDGEQKEYVIFNGSATEIEIFLNELSHAKKIWIGFAIKEALIDGEYKIELFSKNKIIGKYVIINSENIYDEFNEKFLKRKMIEYIPNRISIDKDKK